MSVGTQRYLHVIQRYFPFRGGSERYFQAFSERFARRGAEVQVVTSDAWDLEYFWDPNAKRINEPEAQHNGVAISRVPVRHLPVSSISHRATRRLMAESGRLPFPGRKSLLRAGSRFGPWLPSLEGELERVGPPDLVNSANIAFESMIDAAGRYARRRDVPHVVTPFLHVGEANDSRVVRYYTMPHQLDLLRQADAVMLLTEIERDALLELGLDERHLHIVGAGIDVDSVTGGNADAARGCLGVDGPIVLALGAAAYDKGTMHLMNAIQMLRKSGDDVHLVLAGPMMSEVRRRLDAMDKTQAEGIHALGFVSDEVRRDLLAAADVVALPSRTESFGLVFMEAWANLKPVIGARAGAIPAVVSDGEDGLLVPFGDVAALADAIRQLIQFGSMARTLGERGSSKVVTEDAWFERVRDLYSTVGGTSAAIHTPIGANR
ncbi:MAG: glycosyltransferase family 4 protein [Nitrolancea sp.]